MVRGGPPAVPALNKEQTMTETDRTTEAARDRPKKREVTVTYNGLEEELEYNPKSAVNALLQHALKTFSITDNAHVMALWTELGVELPIEGSVEDAGVKPGDVLVLRPSAVRGGWAC